MKPNYVLLSFRILLLVLMGFMARAAFADADQTTAPLGEFFDPDNAESINNVQSGGLAAKDAKKGKDLVSQGKYKDLLQEQFLKYQNSKVGLMNLIRKI